MICSDQYNVFLGVCNVKIRSLRKFLTGAIGAHFEMLRVNEL